MKKISKFLLLSTFIITSTHANTWTDEQGRNWYGSEINYFGDLTDEYVPDRQITDLDLEKIKGEIRRLKNEESSKCQEDCDLSQETKDYLKPETQQKNLKTIKLDPESEIKFYNKKIKCLMDDIPPKECSTFLKKSEMVHAIPI